MQFDSSLSILIMVSSSYFSGDLYPILNKMTISPGSILTFLSTAVMLGLLLKLRLDFRWLSAFKKFKVLESSN